MQSTVKGLTQAKRDEMAAVVSTVGGSITIFCGGRSAANVILSARLSAHEFVGCNDVTSMPTSKFEELLSKLDPSLIQVAVVPSSVIVLRPFIAARWDTLSIACTSMFAAVPSILLIFLAASSNMTKNVVVKIVSDVV